MPKLTSDSVFELATTVAKDLPLTDQYAASLVASLCRVAVDLRTIEEQAALTREARQEAQEHYGGIPVKFPQAN